MIEFAKQIGVSSMSSLVMFTLCVAVLYMARGKFESFIKPHGPCAMHADIVTRQTRQEEEIKEIKEQRDLDSQRIYEIHRDIGYLSGRMNGGHRE